MPRTADPVEDDPGELKARLHADEAENEGGGAAGLGTGVDDEDDAPAEPAGNLRRTPGVRISPGAVVEPHDPFDDRDELRAALAQLPDLYIGLLKALVFGLIAAIVASYKGMNANGGPKGVGDAVNESVVITFLLLFIANFIMSLIYLQIVPSKGG